MCFMITGSYRFHATMECNNRHVSNVGSQCEKTSDTIGQHQKPKSMVVSYSDMILLNRLVVYIGTCKPFWA